MEHKILIEGPLHPDLFGGETPMKIEQTVDLSVFSVTVCYARYDTEDHEIIAETVDQAEAIAKSNFEDRCDENDEYQYADIYQRKSSDTYLQEVYGESGKVYSGRVGSVIEVYVDDLK